MTIKISVRLFEAKPNCDLLFTSFYDMMHLLKYVIDMKQLYLK